MALSYYSNWEPKFALCDPDQSFPDTWSHQDYFDTNAFFADDNNPTSSFLSNHLPFAAEFEPFRCEKRQKAFDFDQFYVENDQFYSSPVFSSPCLLQEFALPEIGLPEFPAAAHGGLKGGGGSLSAQSIAARQRRRKITEKTQELGKLVPGGQKMNTAEMLQSAYKYIKFLQAQVGILCLISSSNQENGIECSQDFQLLVQSPWIQEKLYSSENCLVPHKFVEELGPAGNFRGDSPPRSVPFPAPLPSLLTFDAMSEETALIFSINI